MNAVRTLIKAPTTARRGEIIEISAIIGHPMESGFRAGADGKLVPRNIIQRVTCHYDGEQVFAAELSPAVSANPLVAFHIVAKASGTLRLRWDGDQGFHHEETMALTVT